MKVIKTTASPHHPLTNAQVEVCNKTVAQYLKTQVENKTLDWELNMAQWHLLTTHHFTEQLKQLHSNSNLVKMQEQ